MECFTENLTPEAAERRPAASVPSRFLFLANVKLGFWVWLFMLPFSILIAILAVAASTGAVAAASRDAFGGVVVILLMMVTVVLIAFYGYGWAAKKAVGRR